MKGLRSKVASKASKIVGQQQPIPKIEDPGPGSDATPAPKPSASPPAPAPAPSGPPKGKDPAAEEPKEDKAGEEKLESIETKLNKLTDSLESLTEVMKSQQRFLQKKLTTDEEHEEEFKDFKEDEDSAIFDESFSNKELGLDTDNLIVSKEEGMPKKSLREARKARLHKEAEGSKTLSEEFDLEKAKKKTFSPKSPEVPKGKAKPSETPSMLKLAEVALELNDGKDKWTVLHTDDEAGDTPLYEIEPTEETKEEFATKGFAKKLIHAMKELGVEKALEKYRAKEVKAEELPTTQPQEDVVEETVEDEVVETLQLGVQSSADFKRRFVRAFRLALSAMQKNLTPNPLKGAFFDMLANLQIPETQAKKIIEAAFSKGADDQLEVALAETDKYLEMADEAFVDLESQIGDLETRVPEDSDESLIANEEGQALMARAARASLPIVTGSNSDPTNRLDALRSVLPKPRLHGVQNLTK